MKPPIEYCLAYADLLLGWSEAHKVTQALAAEVRRLNEVIEAERHVSARLSADVCDLAAGMPASAIPAEEKVT